MQGRVGKGRHLPGDAAQVETAGHVRGQVEFEDLVAQVVAEGHAHRCVIGEDQVALVLVAEAQLPFRADHARGLHAPNLGWFQLFHGARACFAVGVHQRRAGPGEGYLHHRQLGRALVLIHVGRAGDYPLGGAGAVVHIDEHQAIRVRVGQNGHHLAHDDEFRIPPVADAVDGVHGQAGQREALGQGFD